ncbi:M28 family peptidase [Thalassomonas sp. M1454]|uniref:M28 family peptidase n=1 Tax=Thalassomonas sp. M1454 TaxID=2594477 RepID=UPI00163D6DD9|nr:M28 family peptidase [Thalassomonas sp. M1454]
MTILLLVILLSSQSVNANSSTTFISVEKSLERLSSLSFDGRKPGSTGHKKAQQYITSVFNSNSKGPTSTIFHSFTYKKQFKTKEGTNLLFKKIGNITPDKFIVITAHYDHLGKKGSNVYLGADDNASGTAVLLGLQQYFNNKQTKHSIIFVAIDAEEDDLAGSRALLKSGIINPSQVLLNLNLDMIAHGYKQKYLYVNKTSSNQILKQVLQKYHRIKDNVELKQKRYLNNDRNSIIKGRIDLTRASDHYEFAKVGIPYLFITGDNHKYYHKPEDSFEKINLKFYQNVFASIKSIVTIIDNEF